MKPRVKAWQLMLGASVMVCLLAAAALSADKEKEEGKEQKLTKKDLPAAVVTAFEKSYPKAVIKEVSKETEDSTTTYEIVSVDGTVARTVAYTADGKVAEIEEVVKVRDLPQAAQQALAKDYPKAKLERVEKVIKGGVTTFEVLVVAGKERTEVVLDSAGKQVKSEKKSEEEKDED